LVAPSNFFKDLINNLKTSKNKEDKKMEEYELMIDESVETEVHRIFDDYDRIDFDNSGEPLFDSYEDDEVETDEDDGPDWY
jgi:hypothetical protein